jgi:2-iminobutanoate/2-iminopropanoate deaminase
MGVTYIETDRVHPLPWPYSHGIKAGDLLFVAGQVGLDKDLKLVGPGDIEAQARQAWENIRAIVETAGGKVTDVISVTTFLKHIEHGDIVQRVRREYFPQGKYPVATVVEASRLGLEGLLVEIQVVAYLGEKKGG